MNLLRESANNTLVSIFSRIRLKFVVKLKRAIGLNVLVKSDRVGDWVFGWLINLLKSPRNLSFRCVLSLCFL